MQYIDFFDEYTFSQILPNIENEVISGYGSIKGELVFYIEQNGVITASSNYKIEKVYEMALKAGSPVITVINSNGIDLETSNNFYSLGAVFRESSIASGVIPQICIIAGDCHGTLSYLPTIYDFIFMEKDSTYFLESPSTYTDGKNIDYEIDGEVHKQLGLIDVIYNEKEDLQAKLEFLLKALPANNKDVNNNLDETIELYDTPNLLESENIFEEICEDCLELKKDFSNVSVAIGTLGGYTVGLINYKGKLTVDSMDKAVDFIGVCDSFHIPIINFINGCGYINSSTDDINLIKLGGKLIYSYVSITVPNITVIMQNSYGSTSLILNSKSLGADYVFALENVEIAPFDTAFEKILDTETIDNTPQVDEIISASEVRNKIIIFMEILANKRVVTIPKKHGTV